MKFIPEILSRAMSNQDMAASVLRRIAAVALCAWIIAGGALLSTSQTKDNDDRCPAEKNTRRPCRGRCAPIKLKLSHYVEPEYPAFARRANVQDNVVIRTFITEKGDVTDPQVLAGHPQLAAAVMAVVREWVFHPACVEGAHAALHYNIVVHFDSRDGVTVR
jgi:TonB family protein